MLARTFLNSVLSDTEALCFASLSHFHCVHPETLLQKNKNGWHMSLVGREAHWVSLSNLLSVQEGEVNRDWGLAAAPHLPRMSGCGRHPITHLYFFVKPAPMPFEMWHEGHLAKWCLQVTHVVLLSAFDQNDHNAAVGADVYFCLLLKRFLLYFFWIWVLFAWPWFKTATFLHLISYFQWYFLKFSLLSLLLPSPSHSI